MKQTEAEQEYSESRTGERFWVTIAGYLLVTVAILAYLGISSVTDPGGSVEAGGGLLLVLLVLFSIFPYPAFVLDTSYIRRLHIGWNPSWRRYFAVGFLVPVLVFVVALVLLPVIVIAIGAASLAFLVVTILLSSYHLYARRRYLGTP